jgi:hypothetical protein
MSLGIGPTIENMSTQWLNGFSDLSLAATYIYIAGDYLIAGDMAGAGDSLHLACSRVSNFCGHWWPKTGTTVHRYLRDCLYSIDTNWPSGGGTTMASILNAMLAASYDELQQFIGIEDAYRSAIWDQPFNAEFYAALARGFRPWV